MGQTITEKVVQSHAVDLAEGHEVRAGDMVTVRPFHVMTHDNTGAVMPKFEAIGAERIADPSQPVFTLDHNVQDTSEENLAKYGRIEQFAATHGVTFFPAGAGIGHQSLLLLLTDLDHPERADVTRNILCSPGEDTPRVKAPLPGCQVQPVVVAIESIERNLTSVRCPVWFDELTGWK